MSDLADLCTGAGWGVGGRVKGGGGGLDGVLIEDFLNGVNVGMRGKLNVPVGLIGRGWFTLTLFVLTFGCILSCTCSSPLSFWFWFLVKAIVKGRTRPTKRFGKQII